MSSLQTNKMTNYRWVICAMLFFATTVNYLDRQVLSLTYPGTGGIQEEFGWSDENYGNITAVFSIFYAICMLFAGKFIDWMGTKKGYLWSIFVWSTGAVLHAFCGILTAGIEVGEWTGSFSGALDLIRAIIQGRWDWNEHAALQAMVDHSNIPKALVIADRGYESYNTMAHIQEKGWSFLIRIKDGKTGIKEGLVLPDKDEFDIGISLKLTRKQTNEIKELLKDKNHYRLISATTPFDYLPQKSRKKDPVKFYELNFRVVRFRIKPDTFETVLTNLDADNYPPVELKKLYATRWGIETSFRDLKYTIGMLDFHSKKVMCIHQEIYAHLIMYNFSEMITSHVVIAKKQRKHTYKANFSVAVHMCRLFFYERASPPDLETIIARNLIPIRPERHRTRNLTVKVFHGFLYRVA